MRHYIANDQKHTYTLPQKKTDMLMKRNKMNVLHHGSKFSRSAKKANRQRGSH